MRHALALLLLVGCEYQPTAPTADPAETTPATVTRATAEPATPAAPAPAAPQGDPAPAAPQADPAPRVEAAPAAPAGPIANAPTRAPTRSAWCTRVATELRDLQANDATLRSELATLMPARTRAGHLRFGTSKIHDPRATAVFLDRLASGNEPEDVRAALAEALPRTGGAYADALAGLLEAESSARVRSVLVATAARAPIAVADDVIRRGLADASIEVRLEAARTAGAHPDGARLGNALRAALATPDPGLRAEIARTLGVHRIGSARDQLVGLLADTSGDVRLQALRAIDRIAPGSLRDDAKLARLANDSDARVSRLATELRTR